MTPTKKQKERCRRSFPFVYDERRGWFYLDQGVASFHQPGREGGQQDVFGVPIGRLLRALKACGYIAMLLCTPAVAEAKMEIGDGPPGNVTAAEIWADQRAKQKKVITDYNDFLQIIVIKERAEKLEKKAVAENGVLLKLKGEHETIIKLQADQIQACEAIVQQQEHLGSTQDQINQAVEAKLTEMTQRLDGEQAKHKWYALGGAGVGGILVLVIMAVVN